DFYLRAGNLSKASTLLTALTNDKDVGVQATLRLAAIDYDSGNRAKALETVESILRRAANNEDAQLLKVRFLMGEGKNSDALVILRKVVESNPSSARGQYLKALALEATGAIGEAVQTLQALVAENPSMVPPQLKLAELDLGQGNLAQAGQVAAQV